MTGNLYVSTDRHGREHTPSGVRHWSVPVPGSHESTEVSGTDLALHTAAALLDVLDERIFLAKGHVPALPDGDGIVHVTAATLSNTAWNGEVASRFALACAEHILGSAGSAPLVDGTTLADAINDAKKALDGVVGDHVGHVSVMARLSAARRLQHDQAELQGMSLGLASEDGVNGVDAFDDPAYSLIAPVIDAVLGAAETVRLHLGPHPFERFEEELARVDEHAVEDRTTVARIPTVVTTGFGAYAWPAIGSAVAEMFSGSEETPWTAARETARHARSAQRVRVSADAEAAELAWQVEQLEASILGAPSVA